ncbi:MAG: hypothetical protein K6C94_08085, partial [Candidatus Gastranaerophilales bacterium]|nr:hypothetical protein [Candidatus Gastranaerophilales bacterium]
MKRKTPRHILFVLILLFLLSFLALFNFLADPYNIFRNKKYMDIYKFPDNQYNLVIKAYKNFKCDTLVVGGSDLYTMYILQDIYSY